MLYILQGIPGSGKSSFARKLEGEWVVCSADDYHVVNGVYQWDASRVQQAHNSCFSKFIDSLEKNKNTVVDNTNITEKEYMRYYNTAIGYLDSKSITFRTFVCSPMTGFSRNKHQVPLDTIKRMHSNLTIYPPRGFMGTWCISNTE